MNIKEYVLKEKISVNDLLQDGFNQAFDNKNKYYKCFGLKNDINVMIEVKVINRNNKIELLDIWILDDDFGQPYLPFYRLQKGEIECNPFLQQIVEEYNHKMSNIKCFVEKV